MLKDVLWQKAGNTTDPKKPIWNEYVNSVTGESTLSVHTPVKVSAFDTCRHYFVPQEHAAVCKKCGLGHRLTWGIQFVRRGKIISKAQKG